MTDKDFALALAQAGNGPIKTDTQRVTTSQSFKPATNFKPATGYKPPVRVQQNNYKKP